MSALQRKAFHGPRFPIPTKPASSAGSVPEISDTFETDFHIDLKLAMSQTFIQDRYLGHRPAANTARFEPWPPQSPEQSHLSYTDSLDSMSCQRQLAASKLTRQATHLIPKPFVSGPQGFQIFGCRPEGLLCNLDVQK